MVIMSKKKQKKFDLKRCLDRLVYLQSVCGSDDAFNRAYSAALRHASEIVQECIVDASFSDGTCLGVVANGD